MSSPELEIARQQWREGTRRLDELRSDRRAHAAALAQVEVLTAELRRRIGRVFTVGELGEAYRSAESWTLDALDTDTAEAGWERYASVALDATFDLYARGAVDYAP